LKCKLLSPQKDGADIDEVARPDGGVGVVQSDYTRAGCGLGRQLVNNGYMIESIFAKFQRRQPGIKGVDLF